MKLSKKINYKKVDKYSKSKTKINRNSFSKSKNKRKGIRKTFYKTKRGGSFNTRECDSQVIVDKEQLKLIGDEYEYNTSGPATNLNNSRFSKKSGYFYVLEEFKIGKNKFRKGTVIHLNEGKFTTISEENLETPLEIEIPHELFEKLKHVEEPIFRVRCGGKQGKYLSLDELADSIERILYNIVYKHSSESTDDLEETPENEKEEEEISRIFEKVFRELNKLSGLSSTHLLEVECVKLLRSRRDEIFTAADELMVGDREQYNPLHTANNSYDLRFRKKDEKEPEDQDSNPLIKGFIKAILANETYKLPSFNHLELSVKDRVKLFGGGAGQRIFYDYLVFESVSNMMRSSGASSSPDAGVATGIILLGLSVVVISVGIYSLCTTVIARIKAHRREKKINKWICDNLLPEITTTKKTEVLIRELKELNFYAYSKKFMTLLKRIRNLILLKEYEVLENAKINPIIFARKNSGISSKSRIQLRKTMVEQTIFTIIEDKRYKRIKEYVKLKNLVKEFIRDEGGVDSDEKLKEYLQKIINYLMYVESNTEDKNNYDTYFTNLIKGYLFINLNLKPAIYNEGYKFVLFGIRSYSGKDKKFQKIDGCFKKK